MMEYKGYLSRTEFDDEANIFHGEVINLFRVGSQYVFRPTNIAKSFSPLRRLEKAWKRG